MDEQFEVIVQQQVGMVEWNFEQLKNALSEKMKEYDGLVYTEDDVKTAKNDLASLRKLKKEISDKRIEIKNRCLEPYEIIEAQAGELTELIDKPIGMIDGQLSEYEKNRREAVRKEIMKYFDEYGSGLPADILARVKELKYWDKWENATASRKSRVQGVMDAVKPVARDLETIMKAEEEFRESALEAYKRNLSLNDALEEINRGRRQKEMILAKERERIAREEQAKAEAKIAEEKKKAEEELKKKLAEQKQQDTPSESREGVKTAPKDIGATIPKAATQNSEKGLIRSSKDSEAEIVTLRIKATKAQLAKIKGYIEYCGAVYREV